MKTPQPDQQGGGVNPEEATILSDPIHKDSNTHSSLEPLERTSSGETKSAPPISTVVGIGSQFGPYQLISKLGEGGMGAVYKARHTKLGKFVAMKILPQHVMSRSDALARFEREMLAVGSLHHPNVVQAHDAGEFGGVHYLSMEYVEGQDLQELVKARGPMSVVNACKAIRQAAQGLAAAHKLGLVHRDIKPSNLFVTKQTGQIKILDMGLALLSQEEVPAALTSTGQCFGTPDYMAPEQWSDAHTCDARADLYSLGCTLFFLLVGHPPYHSETHRTAANKMKGHVIDPIPNLLAARATAVGWTPSSDRPSSGATGGGLEPPVVSKSTGERSHSPVAPDTMRTDEGVHTTNDIPDGLDAIYRKLMAKAPQDRFASADQLAEALAPFTRQGGSGQGSPVAPRQEARRSSESPKRFSSDTAEGPSDDSPASRLVSRSETATLGETPVDPLSATSTWSPDKAPSASHSSGTVPPRGPNHKWLLAAAGATAMLLMLGVIIITITNKDGTKTRIEVPEGSKIEIAADSVSRAASAPGQSERAKVRGLTPPGSPKQEAGWHGWPADAPKPAIAPFDAEQAQHHQEAWAKYLGVPVEYTNSLGMKFRLIPPGEFTMGSTPEEIEAALTVGGEHLPDAIMSEGPPHKVSLTRAIYLGEFEVTQSQYEQVTGTNPSNFAPSGRGKDAVVGMDTTRHPVEMVSWNDATEFCASLSQREALKRFYVRDSELVTQLDGNGYRLPTEAEWEFSCRAGTTTKYWIGDKDEELILAGWFNSNSLGRTHAVGELKGNPFGLRDIHGNVWEWVNDGWDSDAYGKFPEKSATDPSIPFNGYSRRVCRGGDWKNPPSYCRASDRNADIPTNHWRTFGFRVALTVDAVRQALNVTGPGMPKSVAITLSPPALDGIDFAAERQTAEWVLANKGRMEIAASPDWQWRPYGGSDDAKPLPSEPFVIASLGMANSQVKTESDLERLTRCRYLEVLGISGGTIDRQAIDLLARLPRLKTLTLSDQKNLRTSAFPKLGRISTLDYLSITSDMVDDRLEFVRHLPALRTLNIYGPQPPDITLLAEAPQLHTILLTTPDSVDNDTLAEVQARHGQLRIVVGWMGKYRTVGRDPVHEAARHLVELGVECLGGVNYWQLRTKLLTKADFEDGSVWSFNVSKVPASVQLSADDREKLKLLDSYHFAAEGQRDADELAKSLNGNHGIVSITMTDGDLTDAGLEHLQKLVSLRTIYVTKTKVTPAGVERFHRAVPFCWITSDFGLILPQFMSAAAAQPK